MKKIGFVLAFIVVSLSVYTLVTDEYGIMPYMQLCMGAMLLAFGINELHEKRKGTAIFLFFTTGFILFVGIFILLS
ncbi:DUF3953 domain-containing protein [Lentibacillus jeotgali]|uniref:DUF3953 domain-containing protein n=1 Tax=Lentibacillus jeotgali TaxID=558169 RepID=UPI0002625FFD|nr:DUF3953 domain-containing protein [Lentibacillus jeotgali]